MLASWSREERIISLAGGNAGRMRERFEKRRVVDGPITISLSALARRR